MAPGLGKGRRTAPPAIQDVELCDSRGRKGGREEGGSASPASLLRAGQGGGADTGELPILGFAKGKPSATGEAT